MVELFLCFLATLIMTSTDDATNFYSHQALTHGLSPHSQYEMDAAEVYVGSL
jgi:hypothetical protein